MGGGGNHNQRFRLFFGIHFNLRILWVQSRNCPFATAAAGLDVFETEPSIAADHPLLHAKNAILAPHVGFFSEESLALRAEIVCDNIKAFLDGAPKSVIL